MNQFMLHKIKKLMTKLMINYKCRMINLLNCLDPHYNMNYNIIIQINQLLLILDMKYLKQYQMIINSIY